MFKNRHMQVKVVKDPTLPPPPEGYYEPTLQEKAKAVTDAALTVIDEASKVGTRMIVAYVALDTWRKIAVIAAQKAKG